MYKNLRVIEGHQRGARRAKAPPSWEDACVFFSGGSKDESRAQTRIGGDFNLTLCEITSHTRGRQVLEWSVKKKYIFTTYTGGDVELAPLSSNY